jgi:hypothetical protein
MENIFKDIQDRNAQRGTIIRKSFKNTIEKAEDGELEKSVKEVEDDKTTKKDS